MQEDAVRAIDQVNEKELINLCQELIRIPSHKDIREREKKIASFIVDLLKKEGIEVALQEVVEGRSNVIAKIKGTDGLPTLLFNAHMDTVRPYGMKDPYGARIKDGKIWGRGAADMKAGLAGMIYTLITLKRAGIKLKGDLILSGVIGEENINEGTQHLVEKNLKCDMAIVGEPTNLKIVIAHKGIEWLEITVKGKAAHAGIPEKGVNAIVNAARLICALEKKLIPELSSQSLRSHSLVGFPTFNIGKIQGGIRNSVVPDICKIQLDLRTIPGEKIEDILGEIQKIIEELKESYEGFKAEVTSIPVGPDTEEELKEIKKQGIKVPPHEPMEIPEDTEIVNVLRKALQLVRRKNPEIAGMLAWTEASLLVNIAKIPTAVFGPGSLAQAHTTEEYVKIRDLIEATKVYLLTAVQICGKDRTYKF
ncbi:M20 family metallopeptidase [Patescibacteria group bacterium]|nr:M20 family metallopeptidase [Patescibacteria group bacterium]